MTLRQDCELWATFDSEDVDANRGIVRDRSGKGRTLSASGGPTYGQNSPVGEAVAFDGTDDEFQHNTRLGDSDGNAITLFALVRLNVDDNEFQQILSVGNAKIQKRDGPFAFETAFDTGVVRAEDFNTFAGEWFTITGRGEIGGPIQLFIDGEITAEASNSGTKFFEFGFDTKVGESWNGQIGFVGAWSRFLSNDEIDQLNRMTDRMVSKL